MGEVIDLYPWERTPTGETGERGKPLPAGRCRLVVHVCVFNGRGELLIQQRQHSAKLWPGLWDMSVGGGAKAGDDSRGAAHRELLEELGLDVDFSRLRPVLTIHFGDGFDDIYALQLEAAPDSLRLQAEEVQAVRWAGEAEVQAMIRDGSFIPYQPALIGLLFAWGGTGRGSWRLQGAS